MSLLNQGFPQPLVAPVALAVAQASARPVTGALGAAAPDTYAANGFSPDYVADFSAASADYFRVAGSDSDFATAFTSDSEGGGPGTQVDSSGKLVWRAHNLLTYSEQFDNVAWLKKEVSVTPNADTAPDGTVTADLVTALAGTAVKYLQQAVTTADFNRSAFVCLKENTHRYIQIWGDADANEFATFDLRDGSVGAEGSAVSGSTTALPNGYYLIRIDVANATANNLRFGFVDSLSAGFAATTSSTGSVYAWGAGLHRSDLGGMADNPDPVASGLEKYVPTTTAARYLARRRHHRWDGSAWVPTCLHEPVGATNLILDSRDPTTGNWSSVGSVAPTLNETGIDGVANTACTITDSDGGFEGLRQTVTVPDDSNPAAWACFIKKNASPSTYPGLALNFLGGSTELLYQITFDPSDGSYVARSAVGVLAPDAVYVEDWSDTFWRVTLVGSNNSTGNTTVDSILYVAVNTDGSATWSSGARGSLVTDQWDFVANASLPSSPIITNGSSVARTADTLKGKAASFPWSTTAVSMAVKGRHSRTSGSAVTLLSRYEDADDALELRVDSSNNAQAYAETGGSSQTASGGAVATGADAAFSLAMRYVAGSAIQVATGGTAGSEVTASVPATPPLSDNDVLVLEGSGTGDGNGTVDRIIGWDEDIAAAGLEETSA